MADTQKTNHNNIKTSKTPFAMFKNNPLFFINFLIFHHTAFVFEKLGFAENTIKIVFSEKHSFSKTQFVKPTFSPMSKAPFSKKRCHFCCATPGAEPRHEIFFLFFHGRFHEGCPARQAPPELFGGLCCFFTEHILLTRWEHILRA